MGLFDVFKGKHKASNLEVPNAPPSVSTLPDISSELPEFPESEISRKKTISPIERFQKKAVSEERKELEERENMVLKKPIFVDLDYFKVMLDEMGMVKKHLKEMNDGLARLDDFRSDKQKEFEKWRKSLEDVQRKLIFADKTLFSR